MKYYVYFVNYLGMECCHCFEQDEAQAKHFAEQVDGRVYYGF